MPLMKQELFTVVRACLLQRERCAVFWQNGEGFEGLNLVYACFEEGAFEVVQAEAHTCLDGPQGCLRSFGDFSVCPPLEIGEFDYHALLGGYFHEGCSHLRTLDRTPRLVPDISNGGRFIEF